TIAALWLYQGRAASRVRAEHERAIAEGVPLHVVKVEVTKGARTLLLPAEVQAFARASLYAKVSGYVREIKVDRGQRVKKDQVLAIVESPETEQEVLAARSDLENKNRAATRARSLAPPGVVSLAEHDQAVADERIAVANLQRARSVLDYTALRAPFA